MSKEEQRDSLIQSLEYVLKQVKRDEVHIVNVNASLHRGSIESEPTIDGYRVFKPNGRTMYKLEIETYDPTSIDRE